MRTGRPLSLENLERRWVLDGSGLSDVIVVLNDDAPETGAVAQGVVGFHGASWARLTSTR